MASPSTVITFGYGSFGSVNELPTLGYGIGEAVEDDVTPGGKFRRPAWSWDRTFARTPWLWRRVWRYRHVPNELPVETLVGVVGEDRDFAFDFSRAPELKAGSGITISTVVILPPIPPLTLTIGTPAVLVAEFDGIPIGKGVMVRISGFADDEQYRIACKATLSNGRVLIVPGRLVGVANVEVEL